MLERLNWYNNLGTCFFFFFFFWSNVYTFIVNWFCRGIAPNELALVLAEIWNKVITKLSADLHFCKSIFVCVDVNILAELWIAVLNLDTQEL